MSLRNRAIDLVCNRLKKLKTNEFEIRLRTVYGDLEENTKELLELVTQDFEAARGRDDETNLFIGRFFGIVLLIEAKLESLLIKVDSSIESKMLGRKIDTYRRLIKELEKPEYEYDTEEIEIYKSLITPLKEISKIRNHMAHDLRYTRFALKDVVQSAKLVKVLKPNLYQGISNAPTNLKPLVAVAALGFIVSEKTAILRQSLV